MIQTDNNEKIIITKEQLTIINRKGLQYPLAIAEKDYFLALVSKIIFNSSLKDKLIFKGGTALYHVYLPQFRFSEDLDFSTNSVGISLSEMKNIFSKYDFLEVKKDYSSDATIKIERLMYAGPLNQSNSLKVEIDFCQNVILPPLELSYKNAYNIKTKVRVMDIREITAEKIRAMSQRAKYRDFYDFVMIMKKINVNAKEALTLVQEKEIRTPIVKQNILDNWRIAQEERQGDMLNIYYTEELSNEEILNELNKLDFKIID